MDLLVGLRGERWVRGLLTGAKRAVIRRSRFSPDFGVCVYGHSLRSFNFAGAKLACDENRIFGRFMLCMKLCDGYSTVTLLAKLRGLSTSVPMAQAVW